MMDSNNGIENGIPLQPIIISAAPLSSPKRSEETVKIKRRSKSLKSKKKAKKEELSHSTSCIIIEPKSCDVVSSDGDKVRVSFV